MRKAVCCLYFPLRLLIIILLSPVLTLLYWLAMFPLVLPFHLFRYLLSIIVRSLDSDVNKIVDTFSHVASRDFADWTTRPSHSITMIFKLSNNLTLEGARQLALDKIVNRTSIINGCPKLEYPELQQYYTKRLGFLFYKWDRDFRIENHVNLYSNMELHPFSETGIVNEDKLMRIWEYMMTKPYGRKRSPWEWFIIPSCQNMEENKKINGNSEDLFKDQYTVCILRIHHGLCDGASIYKLLLSLTDNGEKNLRKDIIAFQEAPRCMDLILNLQGFLCGPSSIIKRLSKGLDYYNPLHPPLGKKTGKVHLLKSTLDLETVKNIRRAHLDVSLHSVLIAVITGALRNFLLVNGHSIPLSPIRLGIPFPKPGHSLKLRNEYLISMIELPVEKKTPRQRLFACEKRLNSLRNESVMPFLVQMFKLVGGLPSQLVRLLSLKSSFTVLYSEIKGPTLPLTVSNGKHELMDLTYSFGLGTDDLGVGFNSMSYNGKIHLMVTLDHCVAKSLGKAEQLMQLVEKEIEALQYGDSSNL